MFATLYVDFNPEGDLGNPLSFWCSLDLAVQIDNSWSLKTLIAELGGQRWSYIGLLPGQNTLVFSAPAQCIIRLKGEFSGSRTNHRHLLV